MEHPSAFVGSAPIWRVSQKPIPRIPHPFEEVMKDVLEVRHLEKTKRKPSGRERVPKQ
jgi:hypothetical protein